VRKLSNFVVSNNVTAIIWGLLFAYWFGKHRGREESKNPIPKIKQKTMEYTGTIISHLVISFLIYATIVFICIFVFGSWGFGTDEYNLIAYGVCLTGVILYSLYQKYKENEK